MEAIVPPNNTSLITSDSKYQYNWGTDMLLNFQDRHSSVLLAAINANGRDNLVSSKDALKDILIQNCDNADKVLSNQNSNFRDIILQAATDTAALQLAAANNTAALQMSMCANTAAIQLEATKNAAAQALAICETQRAADCHAAKLAAQIAECCCENKQLIIEKANATDQLIRQLADDQLRDKLNCAREELAALKLRASLAPPLTAAVTM